MTLLTSKEAAAFLRCHVNTLKRLPLPYYQLTKRGDRRYDKAVLERYLLEHARGADMPPMNSISLRSAHARAVTREASSFAHPSFQVRRVEKRGPNP